MDWWELSPARLVLEHTKVNAAYPTFKLKKVSGRLRWYGAVNQIPPGIIAPPLTFWLIYPGTYPTRPPWVEIISPDLPANYVGHDWHRFIDGDICYIEPRRWLLVTTADEIIHKVEIWYFNFLAKQYGLIEHMPDTGLASI